MRLCLRPDRSTRLARRLFNVNSCGGASWTCRSYHCNELVYTRHLSARKLRCQVIFKNGSHFQSRYSNAAARISRPREHICASLKPVSLRSSQGPSEWIARLERFLPPHLRDGKAANDPPETWSCSETLAPMGRAQRDGLLLSNILRSARHASNLDLLCHMGYNLGRWPAVLALMNKLLDIACTFKPGLRCHAELPSNLDWTTQSFRLITNDRYHTSRLKPTLPLSQPLGTTLEEATGNQRSQESANTRLIMSQVWQSLGSLILQAAELPRTEAKVPMCVTFEILARLHHSEFIPDTVYHFSDVADTEANFRPPGMHMLSTHIIDVLSDAAWNTHQASVSAKAAAIGENSPFVQFKMPIRELGSAIWLEFVLWCCVEGAYIKEGVWILQRMKAWQSNVEWKVKSWESLLDNSDALWNTNINTEGFWRQPEQESDISPQENKSEAFYGMGKWTVGTEVVNALSQGVMDFMVREFSGQAYSVPEALVHLDFLDSLLRRDSHRTQEITSQIAYRQCVRFIQCGAVNNETDPASLDRVLQSHAEVVPLWDDSTPVFEDNLDRISKVDIRGTSACLIGLADYNLRSLCLHRQADRAVNALSRLQTSIDESKMQHMRRFLEESRQLDDGRHADTPPFSRSVQLSSSSIPQLSNLTLAGLLDLLTTSRSFGLVEWLLFSMDADGPLIPPSLYSDQVLAPSVIRFAAATRNTELCEKVVQSLPHKVARNCLKALLNFRITLGEWEKVEETLKFLREYRHKSWGESNVTTLAAAVLRLARSTQGSNWSVEQSKRISLAKAKDLLRRVLNGEFDSDPPIPVRSVYQERALYRLSLLFSSIPGVLQEVCQTASLKYNSSKSHGVLPYVPSVAFHVILSAVVDLHGSRSGKRLWEQWCVDPKPSTSPTVGESNQLCSSIATLPEMVEEPQDHIFTDNYAGHPISSDQSLRGKAVIPNLNTVRIIAQAAIKEYQLQQSAKTTSSSSPTPSTIRDQSDIEADSSPIDVDVSAESVLDFCVERYRRLGLDEKEIDREVQGHLARRLKQR